MRYKRSPGFDALRRIWAAGALRHPTGRGEPDNGLHRRTAAFSLKSIGLRIPEIALESQR
jgi:hypothetical protein